MPDTDSIRAFLTPAHVEQADRFKALADRDVRSLPAAEDDDQARVQARELLHQLGAEGWLRPIADQDYRACSLARETLAAASPLADAVYALQGLGTTPLILAGSDELRERFVPAAVEGRAMAAFAMTELQAGSDVQGIATRAVRDGDEYVLDGAKTLISNAGIADFYTVFAVTDPDAGSRRLSCFVVPADTPGLRFVRPLVMSAPHPLGEVAFEGCRVPASSRLGEEGQGLKLGLMTLDRLRATVAAAACGLAERALDEALAHAAAREQFGQPLHGFQLVQQKLARMATDLKAARLLTYQAAYAKDEGAERVTLEAAMAKSFATEAAQRIIDDAVQVIGGRGVLANHPVDHLYRSVRALRIYEGTTEIQHLVIAGHLTRAKEDEQ
jgi:acyl-CoA dehydrogenase